MKILITGAAGMLAQACMRAATAAGHEVVSLTRHELNIADETGVRDVLSAERPDAVLNCAAYTDVDGSEANVERCFGANAHGPENLARFCRRTGALLVTISTDYVFDGTKTGFYTQRDDPNPLSVYGKAKLEGERRAQQMLARTIVVRTGWIFGEGGRNFLSQVLIRGRRGETMKAISDAYGTPTYAPDLAKRLLELIHRDLPGTYHLCNAGQGASYASFAAAALEAASLPARIIESVTFDSLKRPAARPRSTKLHCLLSEALGLEPLRDWRAALSEFATGSAFAPPLS